MKSSKVIRQGSGIRKVPLTRFPLPCKAAEDFDILRFRIISGQRLGFIFGRYARIDRIYAVSLDFSKSSSEILPMII